MLRAIIYHRSYTQTTRLTLTQTTFSLLPSPVKIPFFSQNQIKSLISYHMVNFHCECYPRRSLLCWSSPLVRLSRHWLVYQLFWQVVVMWIWSNHSQPTRSWVFSKQAVLLLLVWTNIVPVRNYDHQVKYYNWVLGLNYRTLLDTPITPPSLWCANWNWKMHRT